jgi:integrase
MATIRKRGSTWNVQIRRKGFDPVTASFDTKAAAEAWARDKESDMDKGAFVSTKSIKDTTVASILDRYAKEVSVHKKSHKWEVARIAWFKREARFTDKNLPDLSPQDLQAWRDKRLKTVSPAAVSRDLNFLSSVLSYAIKEWRLPLAQNPISLVRRPPTPRPRRQRWADTDIDKIKVHFGYVEGVAPKESKDWIPYLVLLAVETAMRRGELVSIKVEHIHLERRFIHLPDTKNGTARDVPLSSRALALVKTMMGKKKKGKLVPFSAVHFSNMLREAMDELDLRHLHFHDTRREAATRMSKKLSNVLELAAVTGHKSLKYLQVYYNPDPTDLADRLG